MSSYSYMGLVKARPMRLMQRIIYYMGSLYRIKNRAPRYPASSKPGERRTTRRTSRCLDRVVRPVRLRKGVKQQTKLLTLQQLYSQSELE